MIELLATGNKSPIVSTKKERRENKNTLLSQAQQRAEEQSGEARERRRRRTPRTGSTNLSNTDSLRRAQRIRARLNNKLSEIMQSGLERDQALTLSRNVMSEIARVDRKIVQIRRREEAVKEERRERARAKRREQEEQRAQQMEEQRRRQRDLAPRSIRVRRSLLYSADEGGLDPHRPFAIPGGVAVDSAASAAVSVNVGGGAVTVSETNPPPDSLVEVAL